MPAMAARAKDSAAVSTSPGSQERTRTVRRAPWRGLPAGIEVATIGEGDQYVVQEFLQKTVQYPTDDQFASQQERPGYQSHHRMVLHQGGRVLAHVLCQPRQVAICDNDPVSAIELSDLCVDSDARSRGLASNLLEAAIQRFQQEGVVLYSLRSRIPAYFQNRSWALGAKHSWSSACPRDVLSLLSASTSTASLSVRVWRQVEQEAIQSLHANACLQQTGWVQRDEEMWRWLVSRGASDQIYVAVDAAATELTKQGGSPIVGYAIARGAQILECCAKEGRDDAVAELIRRVCYDAIESDEMEVRCDAPLQSPAHDILRDSSGRHFHVEAQRDMVHMIRIPSFAQYLDAIRPALERRANAAKLSRPCELGLAVETAHGVEKCRIVLAKRSLQITQNKVGRSYLSGDEATLQQLLYGRISLEDAMHDGAVEASTQLAIEFADALFPATNPYRPLLDDVQ